MAKQDEPVIKTEEELIAFDEGLDAAVCGFGLVDPGATRLRDAGAHDPQPTPYFALQELFRHFSFTDDSRLLDVGCGTGRVLAHFIREGYPGRATGVELDADLAQIVAGWTKKYANLGVIQGNVLKDVNLNDYTDFYLYNPFDAYVLVKFISAMEDQLDHPVTVVHMSDNGDTRFYKSRCGWSELASGCIEKYRNSRGIPIPVYDNPQHYTVWRFDPSKKLW